MSRGDGLATGGRTRRAGSGRW